MIANTTQMFNEFAWTGAAILALLGIVYVGVAVLAALDSWSRN